MLILENIGLYKQLMSRTSNNAILYSGILQQVTSNLENLLQNIRKDHIDFPDHSIQHSFRILNYLSCLLDKRIIDEMSDTELFCIIMSSCFHDSGMIVSDYIKKEDSRKRHHEYSEFLINLYFKQYLSMIDNNERIKNVIKFMCYAHGISINTLYSHSKFKKTDRINFDTVRYSILSVLLRIGDLMDIEEQRINKLAMILFKSYYSEEAKNHNIRNANILTYDYSPSNLVIEVLAENISQYQIWGEWFNYLRNEILYANTYLKEYNINFPALDTKIQKSENANFEIEELRFEIDEKGGIWDILSQSIYTDEFDFVREIIQNAIDATLFKLYSDNDIKINSISPRSWNAQEYCSKIIIAFSEKRKELYILDKGIGMDKSDLKNFLFKVSGSGYSKKASRSFSFPSIAKFGIGFVSCLINANQIDIFTKKDGETGLQVSMSSCMNSAILQENTNIKCSGTSIKLKLKYDYTTKRFFEYVKNTFLFPSTELRIINLDIFENICMLQKKESIFEKSLISFYNFSEEFNSIEKTRTEISSPLGAKLNILHYIDSLIETLLVWIDNNKEYSEELSDNDKYVYFKEMIRNLYTVTNDSEIIEQRFPYNINNIDQKTLFNTPDVYEKKIKNYKSILTTKISCCSKEYNSYNKSHNDINFSKVSNNFSWKYCIVFLSEELHIYDVVYTDKPLNLSSKRGIIFINHINMNFDYGFEYSCINGFLFSDGDIYMSLSKFSGYGYTHIAHKKYEKTFVIGGDSESFNVYDSLEEKYYQNQEELYGYEQELLNIYNKYSVIYLKDNKFIISDELEYTEIENKTFSDIEADDYGFKELLTDNQNDVFIKMNDINEIMSTNNSILCQDGIHFTTDLSNLFPAGFFKCKCNLTASSKMPLNVTRHKFSENRQEIDDWINTIGMQIQTSMINFVKTALKNVSLSIDFNGLTKKSDSIDYFSDSLYRQFNQLNFNKN